MEITIHRGTREIGGTCIQLVSGDRSILIDAGLPLGDSQSHVDLSRINFSDVLISHPHMDHFGLIETADPSKIIHIGELGRRLIDATRIFLGKERLQNTFSYYKAWESFGVGPFEITPYLVDHSAADAYGFLIEADGKRIFYSGDFRAHGRKSKVFERFIADPPRDIDLLLMEGTMMGRENIEFPDEVAVEESICQILKSEPGPSFLICSSQNIDRICAAYRACKRAGRIFVIDIYTAWVLKEFSEFFKTTPELGWSDIRVLSKGKTAKNHYLRIKGRAGFEGFVSELYMQGNVITEEEIKLSPVKYFIKSSYVDYLIESIGCEHASVVYSLWKGYLKEQYNPYGYKRYACLMSNPKVDFSEIHTSGHAIVEDLKRYADSIRPTKLVPIHTENRDLYGKHFNQVVDLKDSVTYLVDNI